MTSSAAANIQTPPPALGADFDAIVVRFAGDSGDGIQVTGSQFTHEVALAGSDIATLPDFPAEIRAPAGSLAGVSGFQLQLGSMEICTPGDAPDVLVVMNPAALKANLHDLKPGGILIANEDTFTEKNLARVHYDENPLTSEQIRRSYTVYTVPVSTLTKEALKDSGLSPREVERCKNFFALGIMLWMFSRDLKTTEHWIEEKYGKSPKFVAANKSALKGGYSFADATEQFSASYVLRPAQVPSGTYRTINGTTAIAYGLVSAAQKSGLPLFFGAYPITPASELLHEMAAMGEFGIKTFQAEDEIAAICAAIGAAYGGSLAVSSSSGPGISLKAEALGLAVMVELPLVLLNMQRGGPSTGLPTKTEQSDLLQALYGRHGESPLCVLAASSPASAFTMAFEACRIALAHMTPVILLSEGYINNCSEPWRIPDAADLPELPTCLTTEHNNPGGSFLPYARNERTLARPWAVPGTPGLMHRIGGLEKQDITGNVSYDPANHHLMTQLRAEKIARIADEIPPTEIDGPPQGRVLIVGWGGTEGTLKQAVRTARERGLDVARIHLHYLNPLPRDLGDILRRYERVLVPEINSGQLRSLLRDKYLVDAKGLNFVRGLPLRVWEVVQAIEELLSGKYKG